MDKTIAAISTAMHSAGIGIVRISGKEAIEIADKVFRSNDGEKLKDVNGYRAKYGKVYDSNEFIDQAIALVFREPHSYTGENIVEISCHGGVYITKRVLDVIIKNGARNANAGEFTKRAFLNGKMDLSEAESVMNLISAQGEQASKIARSGLEGDINKNMEKIKNSLLDIATGLAAWADYPEEDIPQVDKKTLKKSIPEIKNSLEEIIKTQNAVKAVTEGIKIAIVGCPNVGKSSILNMLMGYSRAIVTNIEGTTRDVVEGKTMIGEIPVILFDTAGIRETEDVVERIGVNIAKDYLVDSDIAFVVFDGSRKICKSDIEIINLVDRKKSVAIVNKIDLEQKIEKQKIEEKFDRIIYISTKTKKNVEELIKNTIYDFVNMKSLNSENVYISGQRQFDIIKRAIESLKESENAINSGITLDAITVSIENTLNILGELKGENVSEQVIDKIFSKFCVGK